MIKIDELNIVYEKIIELMGVYKQTIRSNSIHGHKLSKFHKLPHDTRDIFLSESPEIFDARPRGKCS